MSSIPIAAGLRRLRGQMAAQCRSTESDEQLLHAFTAHSDEDAFAVLVHRHGPMVLHVCRRVLGHEQDAEDAFQATFLLLARNAAGLRNKKALAAFLHGAAYRIAQTATRSAARRRKHESSVGALTQPSPSADPTDELSWREVRELLDEEIARLPEKYRSAVVLCLLEGLSQAEAARRLAVQERTLSSRLTEARKRLSQRLRRRGVELTALLTAAALTASQASALPAGLIAITMKAVSAKAAGQGACIVSAFVAQLVHGVKAAMMVNKAKTAFWILLTATLLGSTGAWVMESRMEKEPGERGCVSAPSEALGALTRPRSPEAAKTVEVRGSVIGPNGKPKAEAKLLWLGENDRIRQVGVSAADGSFAVAVPIATKTSTRLDNYHPEYLIAQSAGDGIDFLSSGRLKSGKSVELRLVKDRPIRGRIINTEGKPVAGARVGVSSMHVYKTLDDFLNAWMK